MVQGMAFLSKKGFNPQNNSNRKRVWEAQQHSKQEKERLRQRQEQLTREQEEQELERVTKGEIGGSQAQLRFMYDAPPGLNNKEKANERAEEKEARESKKSGGVAPLSSETTSMDHLTQIKPGDDEAAIAFRRMLAASVEKGSNNCDGDNQSQQATDPSSPSAPSEFKFTTNLQGAMDPKDGDDKKQKAVGQDSRSALEKAVGRKDRGQNLSYQQQIERFPQLKNAPMAVSMKKQQNGESEGGGEASTLMVNFKPLGGVIQHVRCLACGTWGHARGDRECSKSGWDPFALPPPSSIGNSSITKSFGVSSTTVTAAKVTTTSSSIRNLNTYNGDDHEKTSCFKTRAEKRLQRDSDENDHSSERDIVRSYRENHNLKRTSDRDNKGATDDRCSDSESDSSSEEDERRRRHRKHRKRHKSSSASSKKHEKLERKESKKSKKRRKHRRSRSDNDS
jgi:CBF1 interacting corepressor